MPAVMPVPVVETTIVNGMAYGPRMTIPFNGSPTSFQNTTQTRIMVIVGGGSISMIEFSRDNVIYDSFGLLSGDFFLNPGDWIRLSYTLAPTAVYYPV